MGIQARPYTDNDLPDLQNSLATWIREVGNLGYFHVGDIPHRIYNSIRGRLPLHELVKVWEESDKIIGMMIAVPHYEMFNVCLSPQYRGTQVEQDMLAQGYTITRHYMNEIGLVNKPVITEVHQGDEKRIEAALAVGFGVGDIYGKVTERPLDDAMPAPQLADGFFIRRATFDDYEKLANVHNSAFGGKRAPEVYRDEVMRKPGYAPEREFIVVAPDEQFAAFTVTWLDEINKVGYFEPVGVHQAFHRRGLGRALMLHALHEMKRLGMERAQVVHQIDNRASTGLYDSLGFRPTYELIDYIKS